MTSRGRIAVFVAASFAVVLATVAYLVAERRAVVNESADLPQSIAEGAGDATVFFRDTADGGHYGWVSYVSPDAAGRSDGDAPTATGRRCDRIDVAPDRTMICLAAVASITSRAKAVVLRRDGSKAATWSLGGIPSRVRLSPDGSLAATTVFVEGHSYTAAAFSTATEVGPTSGGHRTNLESYRLLIDGRATKPVDRNFWGVTFASDNRTFFATASSSGNTWLVRGDLERRTLESLQDNAECPSLSPDERHVAYKKRDVRGGATWTLAVLDLRSGIETTLGETRSVDDQVEWLDDDTLLYGLPREDEPGTSDVYALDISSGSAPRLFLSNAASPAVLGANPKP
jgi:hypothetical protein